YEREMRQPRGPRPIASTKGPSPAQPTPESPLPVRHSIFPGAGIAPKVLMPLARQTTSEYLWRLRFVTDDRGRKLGFAPQLELHQRAQSSSDTVLILSKFKSRALVIEQG